MIYLVTNQILPDSTLYTRINVEKSLDILNPMKIVGLDTETKGFSPYTDDLLLVQLGNFDSQVVIDCTTIDINLYKDFLESNRLFLLWNAKFDLRFFLHKRIIIKNVYDGYLAEKLMWLGYPSGIHGLGLKDAGYNYCGIELDKTVRGRIHYAGLAEDVIEYGANDVKWLERIREKQLLELEKKDLIKALEYENRFVIVLSYIEYCGVKLDVARWKAKMEKDETTLKEKESALNEWVVSHYPNDSRFTYIDTQGNLFAENPFDYTPKCIINWNSQKQVIPLLKELGFNLLVPDKTTGKMKESIDAKVIEPQKDKSDIAPIYLDYKAAQKVCSTYGQNFIDQICEVDGRIHTNYSQLGADTTRVTSGGKNKSTKEEYVNLLNLPAEAETRACFIAEQGNKWISIDYSGQESALLASIANDPLMLKELNEGDGDIHSLVASLVFKEELAGIPLKDIKRISKESAKNGGINYRQVSKGYEFLVAYGGDASTIQMNYGKTPEEAKKIYDSYMKGLTGVQKYQSFCRKDVMEKGYILLNPQTGHKAYIYDYDDLMRIKSKFNEEFWSYYREMKKDCPSCDTVQEVKRFFKRKAASEKQSINYRIQATGSMCLRLSLIYFYQWILKNNLLFKVKIMIIPYDEINCEAPEEIAELTAKTLKDCMCKAGDYFCTRCKLDADISRLDDGSLPSYWVH